MPATRLRPWALPSDALQSLQISGAPDRGAR
jgi:hypothetical protein